MKIETIDWDDILEFKPAKGMIETIKLYQGYKDQT